MYDYIILTAAVTRPDLHRRVFPTHLDFLGSARVKWLINVDDVGTGATVDETVRQLTRLLSVPNVDIELVRGTGTPCFLGAARRLAARAHELLDRCRVGIVWLEDDWICAPRGSAEAVGSWLRQRLAKNRLGGRLETCPGTLAVKRSRLQACERSAPGRRWYVSLVPRSRVSFNPGIWSKTLFEAAFWGPLSRLPAGTVADPESLCADPLNEPDAYRGLTVLMDARFQDAGRPWSAARGFDKWDKLAPALRPQTGVTYGASAPRGRLRPATLERLTGWVLVPGAAVGLPVAAVVRLKLREGALIARLVALPDAFAELVFVDEARAELYLHRLQRWARTYPLKRLPVHALWRLEDPPLVEVEGPGYRFTSEVRTRMPWRCWWMVPLQGVSGAVLLARSLVAAVTSLDAERPRRNAVSPRIGRAA